MNNPFDFFDSIYCISAESRAFKRKKVSRQLDKLGLLDRVTFFNAILREPYWEGCRESHKECIRKAKKDGANNVLIFEEDVFFLHHDLNAVRGAIEKLQSYPWDIFTLGCTVEEVLENIHENLCVVSGYLNHAYAVNKPFFDTILNFEGSEKYYDDGKQIWSLGRLDLFLTQNNFKKYMIKPIMAVQPDKSTKTLRSYYNKIL
jgi:hypothetical protein